MTPPNIGYSAVLMAAGMICFVVGMIAMQARRASPGVIPLMILLFALSWWDFTYSLFWADAPTPFPNFWLYITYVGAVTVPLALLTFAMQLSGLGHWLKRSFLLALCFEPVLVMVLLFTDQGHGLFFAGHQTQDIGMILNGGPVFWANVVYSYLLVLIAFIMLVRQFSRASGIYRQQVGVVLIGLTITWINSFIFMFKLSPFPNADNTPFSFTITGLTFAFALFRYRLLDVVPMARDALIAGMSDGVVVLDSHDRLVDINPAAQKALVLSPATIGLSPKALSQPWAGIFQRHSETSSCKEEITLELDDVTSTYELTVSTIQDKQAYKLGRLFLFHDITGSKRTEEKLEQLSHAVEQSPASIIITDITGRIEYVNPRFTQVTGYSVEEAVSKNPRILKTDRTPPETHRQLWATITSGREWHGEFINRKKNGELYYESAIISPIIDFDDKITHYLAVKEDVTERKQAEAKLKYQNERLNTLHNITLDLLNRHSMEDVLDAILRQASSLLESPFGLLDILEGDLLVIKATTEEYTNLKNESVPLKESHLSLDAILSREPRALEDYSSWVERLSLHNDYNLKAVVNVPIIINEKVIGLIGLARTVPNKPYTADEIEVMGSFAQLAALAIDNAQLMAAAQNELIEKIRAEDELRRANQTLQSQLEEIRLLEARLREQAVRDPLTGLYNRRYLSEFIGPELARAQREDFPVCFVILDIDRFKNINDTFGHAAGDAVLKKLARQILGQVRIGDIVCRYGGDEFLVVLPNVTTEISFQIADRWRRLFMEVTLPLEYNPIKTTISCGISEFPTHGKTGEELILAADKALYLAKSEGRNSIRVYIVE